MAFMEASLLLRFAPARFLFRDLPAAIGFLYPAVNLSGVARRAERRFARQLPDAVQILSLLVATGQSLSQAMRRLSEGQGMVAAWFRDTLAAPSPVMTVANLIASGPAAGLPIVRQDRITPVPQVARRARTGAPGAPTRCGPQREAPGPRNQPQR